MGRIGRLVRLSHRQIEPLLALSQERGWDEPTLTAALQALLAPLEDLALATIQAGWRRALRRRWRIAAALIIQRRARLRSVNLPRVPPFVAQLEHQFLLLAGFSLVCLCVVDATLLLVRPRLIVLLAALLTVLLLGCLALEVGRQRSPRKLDRRSCLLDAVAGAALVHALTMLTRTVVDPGALRVEVQLAMECTSLRCLHLAVLLGAVPCSKRARQLYITQMTCVTVLTAVTNSKLLDASPTWMVLRGPIVFFLANRIVCKVTAKAMRHTMERESAMAELSAALDSAHGPNSLTTLVDPTEVEREWLEGPLARICAQFLLIAVSFLLVARTAFLYSGENMSGRSSFLAMRITMLFPLGAAVAAAYVRSARSKQALYVALCGFSILIIVVNLLQILMELYNVVASLTKPPRASTFFLDSGIGIEVDDSLADFGVCPANASGKHADLLNETHPWINGESVVEIIESAMAFLRGGATSVLPLSPRKRFGVVVITSLKQIFSTAHRAARSQRFEIAVGLFTREISLLMLGAAAGYIGVEGALASLWKRTRMLEELEVKRRSQLQAKATIILRKSIEDEGAWTAQQETYCSPEVEDAQQAARDQKGRKRATTLANGKMLSDTSSHCDDTDSSVSYDSLPRGSTSSTSKRRRHRCALSVTASPPPR